MAKIILNQNYDEANAPADQKGKYLFDPEDGSEVVELVVWNEKSKKNEQHPEGKPWIKLPKNNVTNRQYFSEDLFKASNIDGEIVVEVKTSAPRVLGATGVKQDIIKYLDESEASEYQALVNSAVEKFKEAKANCKKKKLEDMTVEEIQEYIRALENNETFTVKSGPKSFLDMFTDEEYNRYNELLAISQERKANAPKAKRGPLSDEEKQARKAKRTAAELGKARQMLASLLAGGTNVDAEIQDESEDEITDEDFQ